MCKSIFTMKKHRTELLSFEKICTLYVCEYINMHVPAGFPTRADTLDGYDSSTMKKLGRIIHFSLSYFIQKYIFVDITL